MYSTADISDDGTSGYSLAAEARALLAEGCGLPVAYVTRRLADPDPDWQSAVGAVLLEQSTGAVAVLWDRGWQPADLHRRAAKEKDKAASAFLAVVLAEEARGYRDRPEADSDWLAQVDAGARTTWWRRDRALLPQLAAHARVDLPAALRSALGQLAGLRLAARLPPLPILRPPPSQWSSTVRQGDRSDGKLLARVRALLDKAEVTEYPDEAEALAGKAQELMTRYAIDSSMLAHSATDAGSRNGGVEARRIGIDDPYARQKVGLLTGVGKANGCEVIYSPGLGCCTVFGTGSALELVELLYVSLLLQGTRAMLAAGGQRDARGRSTTRSFRTSFLSAYANRIAERLREAKQTVEVQAEQQYGSALVPVLAARDAAVRAQVESAFPRLGRMRASTVSDGRGWNAGRAAADAADLGGQRLRQPRALGR